MIKTYVFDFYNLYIPKGKRYENKDFEIKIIPLKLAEKFERDRTKISSPFSKFGWKTAKCYIKSNNVDNARQIADWLEFLYSFAQNRNVYFIKCYEYKKGKKYFYAQSKFIENRDNRSSELIRGIRIKGWAYEKDISLFIDISLKTLKDSSKTNVKDIITTIHTYLISKSEMTIELKFLIIWIALEKLANQYHNKIKGIAKSKTLLFSKKEIDELKKKIFILLEKCIKDDKKLRNMKRNMRAKYLYEYNTSRKINRYLKTLDLGFDDKGLEKLLEKLIQIRKNLVHNLDSNILIKHTGFLYYLRKIMEQIIFRQLGIDNKLQKRFIISQYKRIKNPYI